MRPGALCLLISMVRELAIMSLVKHLLSRSEESLIRQLPLPACPYSPVMNQKKVLKKKPMRLPKHLVHLNACAAGIDVGSKSHFVAVPEGVAPEQVREFSTFTDDLEHLPTGSFPVVLPR